jgi:hypothetical protein
VQSHKIQKNRSPFPLTERHDERKEMRGRHQAAPRVASIGRVAQKPFQAGSHA